MPRFLLAKGHVDEAVELELVDDMDSRMMRMFEESHACIVLPGGIGALDETVEVLSWSRLGLHNKSVASLDEDGFWTPIAGLMKRLNEARITPARFHGKLVHITNPSGAVDSLLAQVVCRSQGVA